MALDVDELVFRSPNGKHRLSLKVTDDGRLLVTALLRVAAVALGPDVTGAVSLHRKNVRLDDC
jgi:hypothetical protein